MDFYAFVFILYFMATATLQWMILGENVIKDIVNLDILATFIFSDIEAIIL